MALWAVLGILYAHVDPHASVTNSFLSNGTKRGGEFPTWGRERGKPSPFREKGLQHYKALGLNAYDPEGRRTTIIVVMITTNVVSE